jgi:hypothetical protein
MVLLAACSGQTAPPGPAIALSRSIPPAGGTLTEPDGSSLYLPQGALSASTTLTMTPAPDAAATIPGATLVGTSYTFGPEALQFAAPVTVTLAFDPRLLPPSKRASDVVIFTAAVGSSAFSALSTVLVDATHVSATTMHFSIFAPQVPADAPLDGAMPDMLVPEGSQGGPDSDATLADGASAQGSDAGASDDSTVDDAANAIGKDGAAVLDVAATDASSESHAPDACQAQCGLGHDRWTWIGGDGGPGPLGPTNESILWSVWTGTEMFADNQFGSRKRYNPSLDTWTNLPCASVAYGYYSVVWTGSELITWGGEDPTNNSINTGTRFNPVSGTCVPTATAGAPGVRSSPTAAWTGSEMLVWGGISRGGAGRYNPVTDSWTAMSTTGAPPGVVLNRAVWTGSEMFVWGGQPDFGAEAPFQSGGRYNPSSDTWASVTPTGAPSGRNQPCAIWTGSRVIVAFGWDHVGTLGDGALYDPVGDAWTPMSTVGAPPSAGACVWTGSEMLVWGSFANSFPLVGGRYSPATNSWQPMSTTNAPGNADTAVWTGTRMITWSGLALAPDAGGGGGQYQLCGAGCK